MTLLTRRRRPPLPVGVPENSGTAKVFMANRSQAVRLTKEFQFATDEVLTRKVGDDVILSPRPKDRRRYLETAPVASDSFMAEGGSARPGTRAVMPRFMLETDTCSCIMKRSHPLVLKRLQSVPVDDVCMSVVTKAELLYGAAVSTLGRRGWPGVVASPDRRHAGS